MQTLNEVEIETVSGANLGAILLAFGPLSLVYVAQAAAGAAESE